MTDDATQSNYACPTCGRFAVLTELSRDGNTVRVHYTCDHAHAWDWSAPCEPEGAAIRPAVAEDAADAMWIACARALDAIERGVVTLLRTSETGPGSFCGSEYRASNGWRFGVFDDGDVFDYLEWVETPEGVRATARGDGDASVIERAIERYQPPDEAPWRDAPYVPDGAPLTETT